MNTKLASVVLLGSALTLSSGCGTPQFLIRVQTEPAGASVFLSRRGETSYRGKFGVVDGDFKSEPVVEEFVSLGTTPLEHASPLEQREAGASALGFGVVRVRKFDTGMIRIERKGFEPVERLVRFEDGEVVVNVKLREESNGDEAPPDGSP